MSAFVAVAEHRHFAKAAKQLGIFPSALTKTPVRLVIRKEQPAERGASPFFIYTAANPGGEIRRQVTK